MGSVRPRVFCKLLRDLCTNRTIRYSDKGDQGVVVLNMEYVPELLVLAETLSYTETARRLHMSHSAVMTLWSGRWGLGYLIVRLAKWS